MVKDGRKVDGVFQPNQPLNSTALTPQKPFQITQPKPATQMAGLGGVIEQSANSFTQNLETQRTNAQTLKEKSLDSLLKGMMNSPGELALTDEAYKSTVDPAQDELNDINNQILAEQHGLRRRLESIAKNSTGGSATNLANLQNSVERESIAKQADLSVIQMAKQGKYDSAKAIADRAVAAKFEEQRNTNEALRINYEDHKDLFNTAEQRAFESSLSDRNRVLDREEADLKQISDLSLNALQNGAPASIASQMRSAKTVMDAMAIGGGYVDALDRQLKRAQIGSANRANQPSGPKMLSVAEAQSLGVPFGTTEAQAMAMGLTPTKPATAAQETTALYANRLANSGQILNQLDEYARTANPVSYTVQSNLPAMANSLKESNFQSIEQAQRDWLNAVLRRESGATISPSEFDNGKKQYFAQPGDSEEVVAQKATNRQIVEQGFVQGAGPAYMPVPAAQTNATQEQVKALPIGQTFVVNGKTYKKTGENTAEPI